jgi:phosphate/phosphite/phosphonate ABC transporter binding protein
VLSFWIEESLAGNRNNVMTPTTPANIHILGKYTILERLAVGGMAEVFLANESNPDGIERVVVIKRILPQFARDPQFEMMFHREARVAARINHPNVVKIYELGRHGSYPYLVMEYVDGVTIRDLCKAANKEKLRIPVGAAIHLIMQAAAGAHAAHELLKPDGTHFGLVHRDLTPHNLMVNKTGHLKVLDFGIAKPTSDDDETKTGVLKGKLKYMSPEQVNQQAIDRRSDIFTLATVFAELLTGQAIFPGESEIQLIQSILTGRRSKLSSLRPDIPPEIEAVVEIALSLNPENRYATAEEFGLALKNAALVGGVQWSEDLTATTVTELIDERELAAKHAFGREQTDTLNAFNDFDTSSLQTMTIPLGSGPSHVQTRWKLWTAGAAVVGLFCATAWHQLSADPVRCDPTKDSIHFSFAPTKQPEIILSDLNPLRLYLARTLNKSVCFGVANDYVAVTESLINETVDFASLPPFVYVHAKDEHKDLIQPIATLTYDTAEYANGVLLVREGRFRVRESGYRGMRVCFTDKMSSTGYILPKAFLINEGVDPENDIISSFSGTHHQAILDLVDAKCDIAATNDQALKSAELLGINTSKLSTAELTGETPNDTVVAGPAASDELILAVKDALHNFDPKKHTGSQRVGEHERLTNFTATKPNTYKSVRAAAQTLLNYEANPIESKLQTPLDNTE